MDAEVSYILVGRKSQSERKYTEFHVMLYVWRETR